jgi:hypothetical protein
MEVRSERGTTGADDATIEAAVLRQLLALYPVQVTVAEMVRELAGEEAGEGGVDFALSDAVARAVRELGAVGLLHRNGELLLPSRAALRLEELLG